MTGNIEIRGLAEIERKLKAAGRVASAVAERGLARCGAIALRDAVRMAPRSPTKAQYSATLKRKKRTDRKRFFPGGLEKSIETETKGGVCTVFVRRNSFAGKYARRIHDERGVTWHNLGPGSIAKGGPVGEEFIKRAILWNEPTFRKILESELTKEIGGTAK